MKKIIIVFIILIFFGFACSASQNNCVRYEHTREIREKQSAHHEYPHMSIDLLE